MSTNPEPRNLGFGMRELQRIQDERLAETKPRTCGDCEWFRFPGRDRGTCAAKGPTPRPLYALAAIGTVYLRSDCQWAHGCTSYRQRKDAK